MARFEVKKSIVPLLLTACAAALLVACSTATAAERKTISLDGTWQIAEGSMDEMPKQFDRSVPVPGLVDMATPPFDVVAKVIVLHRGHLAGQLG